MPFNTENISLRQILEQSAHAYGQCECCPEFLKPSTTTKTYCAAGSGLGVPYVCNQREEDHPYVDLRCARIIKKLKSQGE